MQKPNNYENTTTGSDFTPIELGAHYGVIKNVSERESSTGKPMVVVSIDFDKKDKQPGYFTEAFKNDIRPDKKYPYQATQYILTEDAEGKCSRNFKSFMKAFCDSNGVAESAIKWGSDFCTQFKNKKIGVVFGNVEELYNGEAKMRRRIRWFCDYNKVSAQKVPDDKLLPADQKPAAKVDDFVNVPEGEDMEIPFD